MANEINLSPARVLRTAIAHVSTNGMKFNQIGTLQALRSPLLKPLTDELMPERANDEKRLSFLNGAGGDDDIVPTIEVNYQTQYIPTSKKTTRGVNTTGERPKAPQTVVVEFKMYREYTHAYKTVDFVKLTAEAEAYLAKTKAGAVPDIGDANFNGLKIIGSSIMDTIEGGLLTDMNADMLTMLIAGRGGNLTVGKVAPANNVEPIIALYNADDMKTNNRGFWETLNALRREHNIKERLIVIGGRRVMKFMDFKEVVSPTTLGVDQKAIYDKLPVDFYYDPEIDTLYGMDKILVIDPGAACFQNVLEHLHIVKQKQVANTSFGFMSFSIAQYDSPTFDMKFDLRVQESDQGKYPSWLATPSSGLYGAFIRPSGFFKNYGGWNTVTGIFGYQVVDYIV